MTQLLADCRDGFEENPRCKGNQAHGTNQSKKLIVAIRQYPLMRRGEIDAHAFS